MKRVKPVINPSRMELFTLRLMVVVGLICMFLFLREIFSTSAEYKLLYVMLLVTIVFSCLKFLHEWIHYLFITVPGKPQREKVYTVDIFTTFFKGEPYEMIEETLIAIKAITYPHQTYLCDESDDPYLKNFCKEHGIHHVTRVVKVDAKAGNINNALKQSSGEICVVLDPDHVPFPDFLDPIVDHFNNPEIGFVQIVQAYKNYNGGLIAKGAAQQTFQFYGPIMMTMNKYGTVLAIGANCTFRRSALDSIGGHAAGLAEDMHTAMQLHAKGWKSVYVPAVLARGLVPSTLSAYYSQQLKWARGVFELLVTSYPKLFWKFTWQQKLHYGIIPMHYLSGLIFFISFLIPVLSLILYTSPINLDFLNFMVFALPLSIMAILIRLYVQNWVMEEEERGFHVVGGLLMIGTWWIFLLGLVYTLLRKKVPYIPTPKDGKESNNWRLSIPNLCIITISMFAIIYGLNQDYNPYNLIMAGYAGVNCIILLFSVIASRQNQFRAYKSHHPILASSVGQVSSFKRSFWLLRRRIYSEVRSRALIVTLLIVGLTIFKMNSQSHVNEDVFLKNSRKDILIPGVFAPQHPNGLSSVQLVKQLESESKLHFGIISLYLAWGDQPESDLPVKLLDSIYNSAALPMITWEPWQSLFDKNLNRNDQAKKSKNGRDKNNDGQDIESKVFSNILSGQYDTYLDRFSKQIKALQRPVFIRFAHEADNPQYPWSAAGGNTAEEFKAAWRYVHDYFDRNQAHNVIWVWNPWKPEAVNRYFPGRQYVDWIGVTNLNYALKNSDKVSYSMAQLYQPFRKTSVFKMGLPVMLAEMGSLATGAAQDEWLSKAFKDISTSFPEIKAFVLFNSGLDKSTPDPDGKMLDWRINNLKNTGLEIKQTNKELFWLKTGELKKVSSAVSHEKRINTAFINQIKGVNYAKGQNWSTNGHALKKKEIIADVLSMKSMGMNTIKYYGLNFYDQNVLNVARENELQVTFSFWMPDHPEFSSGNKALDQLSEKIIEAVAKYKSDKNIVMWNLANTPLSEMAWRYHKPDLFYAKQVYISWLKALINKIKMADPTRPVSVDIAIDDSLHENVNLMSKQVPEIDCYGLVSNNDQAHSVSAVKALKVPYFFSKITAAAYLDQMGIQTGTFVANWQDEKSSGYVTFDGLKDDSGLNKFEFYRLANRWKGSPLPQALPAIKILLPATTITANMPATFHAVIYVNNQWAFGDAQQNISFKWELIKHDEYGNPLQVKTLGEGSSMTLRVPENPQRYKINLYATRGSQVKLVQSKLNIPLSKVPEVLN
jgi:cellulose synthase (UDP-forming)